MTIIRSDFHTALAQNLIDDIYYSRSAFYHFLGKIAPWESDTAPPAPPNNSIQRELDIRDNILYMWRVGATDSSLTVKGPTWEAGTVFEQWDHTQDMVGKQFFCVNSQYNVYKCLNNNRGAISTVEPTGQSIQPIMTSDGYLWKYMYNIPTFKRIRFLSKGMIPVQKALYESFYNRGKVEGVGVLSGGTGYADVQLTTIVVTTNTTTGSGASAFISGVGPLGDITEITVTAGGSDYHYGALTHINSNIGANANLEIRQQNGVITEIDIVDGGYGYQTGDVIEITVGGAVLVPVISRDTGEFVEVVIEKPGAGYASPPTLIIDQAPVTGTGKYDNPTAILTAVTHEGKIDRVLIEDPGVNYPYDTSTTIVVQGDGEGARFAPVIHNGSLVSVVVLDPGINYSYCDLHVVGTGEGAVLKAIISVSDFLTDQSIIEQAAVDGAIYNVVVTNPGTGYTSKTVVTIEGDGEGATAVPIIETGSVVAIKMTNWGSGYTYARVSIVDSTWIEPHEFVSAAAYAILPPMGGHGFDAPRELFASTVSIYAQLRDDYELHLLEQDYRQYGLIRNPKALLTAERQQQPRYVVSFNVTLSHTNNLYPDDVLINNGKKYRVVAMEGNYVELQQLSYSFDYPEGSFVKQGDTTLQYVLTRINKVPTTDKYSGELLYVTNSTPFTPTGEQTIAVRTYIKL